MPKQNKGILNITALHLLILIFVLIIYPSTIKAETIKPFTLKTESYSIQLIPFERYEIHGEGDGPAIIFAQYGSEAKIVYPAPEDKIPGNASEIIKKCQVALQENIDKIMNTQQKNEAVKRYLSLDGKAPLFKKDDYLRLINNPREQTVQREAWTGNPVAEFRSQEIAAGRDNYLCRYLTFIYNRNNNLLNKIIISVVSLIKQS